jgi:hypothetical protein
LFNPTYMTYFRKKIHLSEEPYCCTLQHIYGTPGLCLAVMCHLGGEVHKRAFTGGPCARLWRVCPACPGIDGSFRILLQAWGAAGGKGRAAEYWITHPSPYSAKLTQSASRRFFAAV